MLSTLISNSATDLRGCKRLACLLFNQRLNSSFLAICGTAWRYVSMRFPIIPTILILFGVTPLLNAQYVRISNDGVIANGGMAAPTVMKSTLTLYTDDARSHGIEGSVTIEAFMGE